jgi:hypothetical protein
MCKIKDFTSLRPFFNLNYVRPRTTFNLKVPGSKQWELQGRQEGGKCMVLVSDRGDQCLFVVWTWCFRVQIKILFPLTIGQIKGDFLRNVHKLFFIFLPCRVHISIHGQTIRCAITVHGKSISYFADIFLVYAASPITRGPFGAPSVNAHYKCDVPVWCAFAIVKNCLLANIERKRRYNFYTITACSKGKRVVIPMVR